MSDKLQPCPMCKSVAGDFDHGQRYWCECINCGVRGAEAGDRHTANEEWNRLASLSSSQQVMNCRPECSGTYWAMEINAKRDEALQEAADLCRNYGAMYTEYGMADRILELKSTPAPPSQPHVITAISNPEKFLRPSPSQPSSVAMTDARINEITMDTLGKWPSFEAQSWACKVVHAVLQSSPKGASTGTEPFEELIHQAELSLDYRPEFRRAIANAYSALQSVIRGGDIPDGLIYEAASKAHATPELNASVQSAYAASQPSVASGRKLPPLPAQAAGWVIPGDDGGSLSEWVEARQFEKGEFSAPLFKASQMREYALAALTGAAPADANVGERLSPEDEAEHFIQEAIDMAPEPLCRLGEYLTNVLDEDQWKTAERMLLGIAQATPTAPEPSAPADKVNTERLKFVLTHGNPTMTFSEENIPVFAYQDLGIHDWKPSKIAAIDAAIDRMRSESGQGGKL